MLRQFDLNILLVLEVPLSSVKELNCSTRQMPHAHLALIPVSL